MVNVNPAAKFRQGSQGLLDLALTSGDKYQPVLANIDKTMTDADFLQFNNLIDPLIDSFGYMLYEKISNSITEE